MSKMSIDLLIGIFPDCAGVKYNCISILGIYHFIGEIMVLVPNATSTTYHTYMDTTYGYNRMQVSWSGNTVSWYSDQTQKPAYQMNSPSPYYVLAFYQADAE